MRLGKVESVPVSGGREHQEESARSSVRVTMGAMTAQKTFPNRHPVLQGAMRLTDDLTGRRAIFAEGGLFLLLGLLASAGLLAQSPTLESAAPIAAALWAFCRWYLFMFYVVKR